MQPLDLPDFKAWYQYALQNKAKTFFALGMILGLLAVVQPWYGFDIIQTGRHNPLREYSLTAYTDHFSDGHYSVYPLDTAACACASVSYAFNTTFVVALLAALVGTATAFGHMRRLIKGDLTVALIAVAGLLFILAPVLLATSLPGGFAADNRNVGGINPDNAWGASFIGANNTVTQTVTWGPSSGFWLSSLAGLLMFLCVYQIKAPRRPALAPAPGNAPAQYSAMTPVGTPPAPGTPQVPPAPMP